MKKKPIIYGLSIFMSLVLLFCPFDVFLAADMVDYPLEDLKINASVKEGSGSYVAKDYEYIEVSENCTTFTTRLKFTLNGGNISADSDISLSLRYYTESNYFTSFKITEISFNDVNDKFVCKASGYSDYVSYTVDDESLPTSYDIKLNSFPLASSRSVDIRYIYLFITQTLYHSGGYTIFEDINMSYHTPDASDVIVTPTPEDQEKNDAFNSEVGDKSSEMDNLIADMDSMIKPDSDDLVNNIDKYIPADDIATYSAVLSSIFDNDIVLAYVMIALVIALVSFVLFGKK